MGLLPGTVQPSSGPRRGGDAIMVHPRRGEDMPLHAMRLPSGCRIRTHSSLYFPPSFSIGLAAAAMSARTDIIGFTERRPPQKHASRRGEEPCWLRNWYARGVPAYRGRTRPACSASSRSSARSSTSPGDSCWPSLPCARRSSRARSSGTRRGEGGSSHTPLVARGIAD